MLSISRPIAIIFLVISASLLALPAPAQQEETPPLSSYGGWMEIRRAATGFFRVTRTSGRWWLVDPDGYAFLSIGVNNVGLRPPNLPNDYRVYYRRRALEQHRWFGRWADNASRRLQEWGFNTVGVGSDESIRTRGIAFTLNLNCSHALPLPAGRTTPDVFDERYERALYRHVSSLCRRHADNRWLIGYYTDVAAPWGHEAGGLALLGEFLGLEDGAPGRRATLAFLTDKYYNIDGLNDAWGTSYRSLTEIGRIPQVGSRIPTEDIAEFQRLVAAAYFRLTYNAIRATDQRHLIFGPKFQGPIALPVLQEMHDYIDLVSVIDQDERPPREQLQQIHFQTGKPVLLAEIGAWSLRERQRNNDMLRTQGDLYEAYLRETISLPMVLGVHWHAFVDDFGGQGIGLVDLIDAPQTSFLDSVSRLNREIYKTAAGSDLP